MNSLLRQKILYYDPNNWYWKKEDGTIYSSKQQAFIQEDDSAYQAFLEAGGYPTPYPKDIEGQESDDELAKVLEAYGLELFPPSFEQIKEEKWQQIKQAREDEKSKGFLCNDIRFDGDEAAQANINAAALTALQATLTNTAYQVEWTVFDNQVITLDAEQMLGLQNAMAQAGANIHAYASKLRKLIEQAENQQQLDAISWQYDELADYTAG